MPALSKRPCTSRPYSSPLRSRSVTSRHCAINCCSRKSPNVRLELPVSITRSIRELLGFVARSGQNLLDEIRGTSRSVLLLQTPADFHRTASVRRPPQQLLEFTSDSRRNVFIAIQRTTRADLTRVFRVVR